MRLPSPPRPADVPVTAGVSGIVFVLAVFKFGGPEMFVPEALIFGVWGLLYLVEWAFLARGHQWNATRKPWPRSTPDGSSARSHNRRMNKTQQP